MKVTVEISDEQIVEFLRECARTMISGNPLKTQLDKLNFRDSMRTFVAMDEVVHYLSGHRLNLEDLI